MLGGSLGLGVLEQAMRAALATAGAAMLQAVLDEQDDGYATRVPGAAAAGRPCMRAVARRRSPPSGPAARCPRAWPR